MEFGSIVSEFGGDMTTVWQDIRYGGRALLRAPGMTLVGVMTLALGIGANIAIFSIVEAVLLRPLPYAEPGRMVLLGEPQNPDGATFLFPERPAQMWLPISANRYWNDPQTEPFDPNHDRGFYARWRAVARLRANVSNAQGQAELDTIYARLQQAGFDRNRVSVRVSPLSTGVTANTRLGLMMLWAAVAAVLLVACTNVSNLVLARGLMRQRELAVRATLGATVGRLVRQLLTESVLLAT